MILNIMIFVIFLPIGFIAIITVPNAYEAQGIVSAIDCDGPFGVMLFAVPAFSAYGFILLRSFLSAYQKGQWQHLSLGILSLFLILLIIPNTLAALKEHNKEIHIETCGSDW